MTTVRVYDRKKLVCVCTFEWFDDWLNLLEFFELNGYDCQMD